MIYDCFLFYNEFDVLNIRLNELSGLVDKHILIEADRTFTGKEKQLFFRDYAPSRVENFDSMPIMHSVFHLHEGHTAWEREQLQRDHIKTVLEGLKLKDDDFIILSDVEEIPNRSQLLRAMADWKDLIILEQRTSYYYFNNVFVSNPCPMAKLCKWKALKNSTPTNLRKIVSGVPTYANCGWNFSNLGSVQDIKTKLEAFSHQEYKHLFTEEKIAEKLRTGQDLFERPGAQHEMKIIPLDDSFPKYILDNQEQFAKYIVKQTALSEQHISAADKLKVYWFGYGGSAHYAEELRPLINSLGMTLTTIHEHDNADVRWNLNTWKDKLKKADIIILPCKVEDSAKSNTRLSQAMALGKPVICSPLRAYLEVEKKYPGCCLIPQYPALTWEECLRSLIPPERREMISKKALEASRAYSIDAIGKKWENVLFGEAAIQKPAGEPIVDIIIPTSKNLTMLKLCVESIRTCTNTPYRILVVENGSDSAVAWIGEDGGHDLVGHYVEKRLRFAEAINYGLEVSTAKYVCFLNDDTIVSHGWLERMLAECKPGIGAVGVLSNCDRGWLHDNVLVAGGVNLLPGTNTLEEIRPIIPELYRGFGEEWKIFERDWIAFYCTLIPREVIDKVGILDDFFSNSGEDVDYCKRIRKMDYKIIQNFNAFVFHFGAAGRAILKKEDPEKYMAADANTQAHLKEKWDNKGLIVLYSGKSWEQWDAKAIEKGIGGSETWQIMLAKEFARMSYRVVSFCDCPETMAQDGVWYLPYGLFDAFQKRNYIDLLISSRTTESLTPDARAGLKLVMVHDVHLLQGAGLPANDSRVDYYLCLSEAHKLYFSEHHRVPLSKILITSNGIDLSRFQQTTDAGLIPPKCIYSSSPDRGLDNLLNMWPLIRAKVPKAELHVYYGFNNFWSITDAWRVRMEGLLKQPGVTYHGRVSQEELAKAFMDSKVLLYPSHFEETFCITALEAMAAGCVVLSSAYWGIKDTVKGAGVLIPIENNTQPWAIEYQQIFIKSAIRILTDEGFARDYRRLGFQRAAGFSWERVARQLLTFLESQSWSIIQ